MSNPNIRICAFFSLIFILSKTSMANVHQRYLILIDLGMNPIPALWSRSFDAASTPLLRKSLLLFHCAASLICSSIKYSSSAIENVKVSLLDYPQDVLLYSFVHRGARVRSQVNVPNIYVCCAKLFWCSL